MQDPRILIAAAVGFLVGVALLWWARRSDRRNWFIERAPQLPLRLVNPSDDVWVDGTVACDAPLHVPWFDVPCVHYSYTIEKKVRRTRRTSDGKTETYYTWVNEHSDSGSTRFRLVDEDASIEVVTEDVSEGHIVIAGPGEAFRDFVVEEGTLWGAPGFIGCLGIESPGLTSSLALAERVAGLVAA